METQGVALQSGMMIEKMLFELTQLLPGFDQTVSKIIPLLRDGILQSMRNTQGQGQAGVPSMQQGMGTGMSI